MEEEYIKRIKKYSSFEIRVFETTKFKDEKVNRQKNWEKISKHISPQDLLVLLDEKGTPFSSLEFAKFIESLQGNSIETKKIIFLVGGASGFSPHFYERSNFMMSLSNMTFTHQMIRLFLLEQIYRAFTIINHHPYHNE